MAPPMDLVALIYFCIAVFAYRVFVARQARFGGGLLGAIQGKREHMDDFVRMNAGTISPAQFLSPENIGMIMAAP